ncbi:hypothetical protein EVAR_66022_1 [Eumeta japonica]|uniref:Uncharacterized protein n=1 Tax=Eumeta variegata TaxID=151549 RepID=A0A4C1Z3U6_EUMVA|nr:hypothetical protein EVAR_66022_1 [Eumeta japonica]
MNRCDSRDLLLSSRMTFFCFSVARRRAQVISEPHNQRTRRARAVLYGDPVRRQLAGHRDLSLRSGRRMKLWDLGDATAAHLASAPGPRRVGDRARTDRNRFCAYAE